MVSSELVVLLIVCVGINTGSAQQEYCQGGPFADRTCEYNRKRDTNTDCMDTTLQCVNNLCSAIINSVSRTCTFDSYIGVNVAAEPIRCCFCNRTTSEIWWDCNNMTTPPSPSSTTATQPTTEDIESTSSISTTDITTAASLNFNMSTIVTTKSMDITMTTSSSPNVTRHPYTATTITSQTSTTVAMPSNTMTTEFNGTITIVIVPVVVVLVVCLLVVCVIATIIILYQKAKHREKDSHPGKQHETTELYDLPTISYADIPTPDNGQYNHTHHGTTPPPPIYSTLAEEGAPADYSTIADTVKTPCDSGRYNHTHHGQHNNDTPPPPIYSMLAEGETTADYQTTAENAGFYSVVTEEGAPADYSVITETQDTSDEGMVYSAVVRKDGRKTTVKTTAHLDDSQQQPALDTSNEGLVYSAVVVKDGKKTTVKTTAQTSSTSDTVQSVDVIEGMVYSAVIRQDGKKTSVKVTVE